MALWFILGAAGLLLGTVATVIIVKVITISKIKEIVNEYLIQLIIKEKLKDYFCVIPIFTNNQTNDKKNVDTNRIINTEIQVSKFYKEGNYYVLEVGLRNKNSKSSIANITIKGERVEDPIREGMVITL